MNLILISGVLLAGYLLFAATRSHASIVPRVTVPGGPGTTVVNGSSGTILIDPINQSGDNSITSEDFGPMPSQSAKLDITAIAQIASEAGFPDEDLATAVAIALAESDGEVTAIGDKNLAPLNGPSLGLWQINVGQRAHPEWANENLFDPRVNADKAFELYMRRNGNFEDWSTFDPRNSSTPRYLAYLDQVTTVVNV